MERKEVLERLRADPPLLPKGFLNEQGDEEERQLLLSLLHHDPAKRPTAAEVIEEKFNTVFMLTIYSGSERPMAAPSYPTASHPGSFPNPCQSRQLFPLPHATRCALCSQAISLLLFLNDTVNL
jgi:serine/threonine protein kinase